MKDSECIEILDKVIEENATHELEKPFRGCDFYDGNDKFIIIAMKLAYEKGKADQASQPTHEER